jgi:hypothetical protein
MTQEQNTHARKVAQRFRDLVEGSDHPNLDDEHFEELILLIESAIDSVLVEKMEKIADAMDDLAKKVRSDAEHFD